VFYVSALFGWGHLSGWADWGIAIFGLWVPAAVNLAGVRQMAWFQNDIDGELGCAHRGLLL
jgi:APA family basic amino acid/polyamine antiporter